MPSPSFCPPTLGNPSPSLHKAHVQKEWDKDVSGGGTPVRATTRVPEPQNGWADKASPRDSPGGGVLEINFPLPDIEGRVGEALERPPLSGIGIESETLTKPAFLIPTRVSHNIQ